MRHPVSDRVFRHGFGASIREWSESNRQDTRFIFGRISHGCASWIRTNTGNCISTSIRLGVEQKPSSTFNHASFSQFGYRAIYGMSMRNRTLARSSRLTVFKTAPLPLGYHSLLQRAGFEPAMPSLHTKKSGDQPRVLPA